MGKINGLEDISQVPPKVRQMYGAVIEMLEEGMDASGMRVSAITERAGIGKGTAYEYFDSKEELVACAVVYQIKWSFDWLKSTLEEKASFQEQFSFVMEVIRQKDMRLNCFLRFVHMMTDNSEFSRMVREKLNSESFAAYQPVNIFGKILRRGVERGELRGDIPMEYMVFSVFAHLLTYVFAAVTDECFSPNLERIKMLASQGILNELGSTAGTADCRPGLSQF
nr:TetR/AcrR family transcriptional regulator [uncultured Acetatifactor sp.]